MKNLIKKIGVFVFALVLMVSTASTVLAFHGGGGGSNNPGDEGQTGPPGHAGN